MEKQVMKLVVFHALWGMEGSLREKLKRAASHGYAGIESPMPSTEEENEFLELLDEYKLKYIPQIFSQDNHEESLLVQLDRVRRFNPVLINSHSGKDHMTEDAQDRFFEAAVKAEKEIGIQIGHETHRGRAMFTPRSTARLLRMFPELNITADFSHFTCVCESLLHDQEDDLALIMSRTIHVHGRVGHAEGPQVPHPAAPEYAEELARFQGWWDTILSGRSTNGVPYSTVTPEFGPPGYMPRLPFTRQPIADLFEVNHWIAELFWGKYGK
jgi:hypothetical protein